MGEIVRGGERVEPQYRHPDELFGSGDIVASPRVQHRPLSRHRTGDWSSH